MKPADKTGPRMLAFDVRLEDIEWDITDEEWEASKDSLDLPRDYDYFTWAYDVYEAIDFAIEAASDKYGFCILNCESYTEPGFQRRDEPSAHFGRTE